MNKAIALRIKDPQLHKYVTNLSKELDMSLSLTSEMLIAYAFSQIQSSGKKFTPKIVFTTE